MQSNTLVFLGDLVLTLAASLGVVFYLRGHLRPLVIELCGSSARAEFWLALSYLNLILVPIIFALYSEPQVAPDKSVAFAMADQLKVALVGLVATLVVLGIVLMNFVRRFPIRSVDQRDQ